MEKKILLVEYDNQTIDKVTDILSSPVFNISMADAGDSAKKLLKKQNFDLVITAAMLPRFHGFDLSKFIASNYPDSRILVMSSVYKGVEYKNQAISEFGADAFLEKPLNDDLFKNTVLSLLNITENDIKKEYDSGNTQIPTSDTKKINITKINDEEKLSSDDIFGDIIDKVEKDPNLTIDLDENDDKNKKNASTTQVLDKDYLLGQTNINPDKPKTYKEREIDFNSLIDQGKTEKKTTKSKEIEDDISKKLEETLSGLGLDLKSSNKSQVSGKKTDSPDSTPDIITDTSKEIKESNEEIEGYEILDMIARGGMAEIYKAKKKGAKGFEKIIVIKKILSGYGEDDKYIEMFVDEAKIAAELTHPNIVQIYDFGKKDNFYFIAMEYVEGKDLRLILNKLMEKNSILEEHLSIFLIIKILEALSYAHSAKDSKGNNLDIVHRDISPPNILVSYSGEVKLTDFGVSKASNKSHQTLSGALKGKLLYMSPEQANAEKNIDNRSDLYSVGIILFELLTGQKMFSGATEIEVLNSVQEGKIIKPSEVYPDINPDLESIILKSVSLNKDDRYRNATEMITELENYLYVNYNHVPTPVHIQHKLKDLFKDDILKSGTIVNPKPIPFEIEKIVSPQTAESIEKSEESVGTDGSEPLEVIELNEESEIQENPVSTTPEDETEQAFPEPPDDIKEKPVSVEIDLDNPEEEIEPVEDLNDPIIIDSHYSEKRKTRPVFKIILFAALLIFSVYYFLLKDKILHSPLDISGNNSAKVERSESVTEKPIVTTADNSEENGDKSNQDNSDISDNQSADPTLIGGMNQDSNNNNFSSDGNLTEEEDALKQKEEDKKIEEEKQKLIEEQKLKEKKRLQKIEADKRRKKALEEKKKKAAEEKKRLAEEEKQRKLEEERIRKAKEEKLKKEEELKRKREEEERNRTKPGQLISLAEVDIKPIAISTPPPKLTRSQKTKIRQGIIVMALISHSGNVEKVRMLRKSGNKKIDSIISNSILSWKYKPAVKDGVKVKVWKTINLQ